MRYLAAVITTMGLLMAAPSAQAHELTCSKSRFGHRAHIEKNYSSLKVDNVPGHDCVDTGKNSIRYVACRGRVCARQDVRMTYEYAWGPFWFEARYSIGAVRWGYHG